MIPGIEKMTQKEHVLAYLQEHGCISPREAEDRFGCMRLAARIKELRSDGHPIKMTLTKSKNRYGTTVQYATYYLDNSENNENSENNNPEEEK